MLCFEKKNSNPTTTSNCKNKKQKSSSDKQQQQQREASPSAESAAASASAPAAAGSSFFREEEEGNNSNDGGGGGDDLFATARDLDLPQLAEEEEEEEEEEREKEGKGEDKGLLLPPRAATRSERPSLSDYAHVAVIGRGAFGEVRLVRELKNGNRLAALKSLDKAEMLRRRQVAHVRAERDALATLRALSGEGRKEREQRRRRNGGGEGDDGDESGSGGENSGEEDDNASNHVVALRASFQDEKRLHLVMEYLPGGDLMTLLMRMDVLPVVSFLFFSFFGFFFFPRFFLHPFPAPIPLEMRLFWLTRNVLNKNTENAQNKTKKGLGPLLCRRNRFGSRGSSLAGGRPQRRET